MTQEHPDLYNDNVEFEYYENLKKSWNPIQKWFHLTRFEKIHDLVYNAPQFSFLGKNVIVDIGCGSAEWNIEKIPVIGVDTHEEMLGYALKKGNISQAIRADVYKIPLQDDTADIVIMSEIIEHLENPHKALKESERILKQNGLIIVSVPYDKPFTLWYILFNLQCIIKGFIFRNNYFRNFGGHIQHFNSSEIAGVLWGAGFGNIHTKTWAGMSIFATGMKGEE